MQTLSNSPRWQQVSRDEGGLASVRRRDLQALQMQETRVPVWPSVLGLTGQSWLAAAQGHPSWSSRDKQLACHQEDS